MIDARKGIASSRGNHASIGSPATIPISVGMAGKVEPTHANHPWRERSSHSDRLRRGDKVPDFARILPSRRRFHATGDVHREGTHGGHGPRDVFGC